MSLRRSVVLSGIVMGWLPVAAAAAGPCFVAEKSGGPAPAWLAYCAQANATPWAAPWAAEKAATDVAAVKDFWNGRYGTHLLNNFPGFTQLGPQNDQIWAIDWDLGLTTLYALNSGTSQFGALNTATGAFTAIGPSAPIQAGHDLWSGLSVDPRTGKLFAVSIAGSVNAGVALYTIDPATGAPTQVGFDATGSGVIDLSIDCSGRFFVHDIVTDSISTMNPVTGALTLVGPTGANSNFAQGLDFDNDTGILYAWTYQGSGANLYGTIDLATGTLTPLSSSNPIGEWEGAVQSACSPIFDDGFESGSTSAWSSTVP